MNGNLFDEIDSPGSDSAKSSTTGWFVAHCDGGSRGNPGPSGYGAVIEDPQGRVAARLSEYLGKQTNNYAEYSALLAVLKWANRNHVSHLKVVSDSELMVNQMKGRYKVGSPGLRPLWEDAKRQAAKLEKFQITHTLRGGNKEADQLANDAMDRGMGKKPGGIAGQPETRVAQVSPLRPGKAQETGPQRQIFEGLVKNGVIHLIDGELPEGILVKVIRE